MQVITDLHIHSRYSRACSKQLELPQISQWCVYKGIDLVGTSDFTFPAWNKDLNTKLEEVQFGIFKLKDSDLPTRFLLTTELSFIYKKNDKCRRQHICVLAPSLSSMNKLTEELAKIGNIKSDGRPILGLKAKDFLAMALSIDPKFMIIPAHVWTPWFSVFGSKSGYDSLEECFEELTPHIHAIETGLSSDPDMNRQWSALDNITLVSNSDAHSLENLGRNANVLDLPIDYSYNDVYQVIKDGDPSTFKYTIEFFPEEGKYHLDGHAKCGVRLFPEESLKHNKKCPKCQQPLVLGVMHRVHDLADRKYGSKKPVIPFKKIIPLAEIISNAVGVGKKSKRVMNEYMNLVIKGGNEFKVLLDLSENELKQITLPRVVQGIMKMRSGEIVLAGGYDGVFGTVTVFPEEQGDTLKGKLL